MEKDMVIVLKNGVLIRICQEDAKMIRDCLTMGINKDKLTINDTAGNVVLMLEVKDISCIAHEHQII